MAQYDFMPVVNTWNNLLRLTKGSDYEEVQDVLRSNHMGQLESQIISQLENGIKMKFGLGRRDIFHLLLVDHTTAKYQHSKIRNSTPLNTEEVIEVYEKH